MNSLVFGVALIVAAFIAGLTVGARLISREKPRHWGLEPTNRTRQPDEP